MPELAADAVGHALDALRSRGADRFDPVRFRFIEAFARRAAGHAGPARRVLDEKLAGLVAAYESDAASAEAPVADTGCRIDAEPPRRGPLADLVDHVARRSPASSEGRATSTPTSTSTSSALPVRAAPAELEALQFFRQTWAKLSVEQRLAQSLSALAALPGNAGPLNSHRLVHRSLTLMRELSPAYLESFVAYTDALLWIEETQDAGTKPPATTPRAVAERRVTRGR